MENLKHLKKILPRLGQGMQPKYLHSGGKTHG